MESNLRTREATLNSKIPEINSTLQTVKLLISQNVQRSFPCRCTARCIVLNRYCLHQELGEPLETDFELNDTLYAKATIQGAEKVCIWLGVRVSLLCCLPVVFPPLLPCRCS